MLLYIVSHMPFFFEAKIEGHLLHPHVSSQIEALRYQIVDNIIKYLFCKHNDPLDLYLSNPR